MREICIFVKTFERVFNMYMSQGIVYEDTHLVCVFVKYIVTMTKRSIILTCH